MSLLNVNKTINTNINTFSFGSLTSGYTNNVYPYNFSAGTSLFNFDKSYTNSYKSFGNYFIRDTKSIRLSGNMGNDIVATAQKYIGYNESDGSFKKFTGGKNHAWCGDFVTYTVREAFSKNGKYLPSDFGSSSVSGLRSWGQQNNCYLNVNGKNKAREIANKVKPGDVVIFKNGTSHTGIVSKVNSDGSFETIEGNTSNKVAYRKYSGNNSKISGFVQIA